MKNKLLVSIISVAGSAVAFAAPVQDAAQFEVFPKNLARQHVGTNLFQYNATTQGYAPTQAAAAWLDDDISTGWPAMAGQQYYLLALPEAELVTNFSVSARPASGTISLYAADEPAVPGAKAWSVLAKDVAFDSINQHKLDKPFSRSAKYVLIETNLSDPGPIYSLYMYSERPAVSFNIEKRPQAIDTRAIFGPYANDTTAINVAGLYAHSYVSEASSGGSSLDWQKAIDDNPETALMLGGASASGETVIQYAEPQSISRIALLTDPDTRGKLDFFLVGTPTVAVSVPSSTPAPAAAAPTAPAPAATVPAPAPVAATQTPTASVILDGTNARTSIDLAATTASTMRVRWTPANGTDSIKIREIEAFGTPTLATYAVNEKLSAIAERKGDRSKDGKDAKDHKEAIAEGPDAIAALQAGPYLPGSLGFPPNFGIHPPPAAPHVPPLPPSPPPLPPGLSN